MPYDNVYIRAKDKTRLHCWFIHRGSSETTRTAPTLLYLHANAGNMGFRLEGLQQLWQTLKCNILIVSYRGYGESEGKPEESGLCLDAEAALLYLRQRKDVDNGNIILFGRSLGGAVSIALANKHSSKLKGVILENTFTSISDLVNKLFPFVRPLKRWVLRLQWHSQERIADVTTPILFLSGQQDEVVPKEHMRNLYNSATKAAYRQITCFPKGKHNDTWKTGGLVYQAVLQRFLARLATIERHY